MHELRIKCTGRPSAGLQAAIGTSPPAIWDSDDLSLRVWLDAGTRTNGVADPFDVTTITTLTLEMRETPETSAMLIAAKAVSSFAACTLADFVDGDGQHATFEFSDTDTNTVGTLDQAWISIVATLTDGSRYTWAAGYVAIIHSGADQSAVVDPIETYASFQTVAVSGQSNVVATGPTNTLTLVAGAGITIATNAATDAITITGHSVVSVDNRISRGDGTAAVQSSGWAIDDNDQATVTVGSTRTALTLTASATGGTSLNLIAGDSGATPLKITNFAGFAASFYFGGGANTIINAPQSSGTLALTSDIGDESLMPPLALLLTSTTPDGDGNLTLVTADGLFSTKIPYLP